MTAEEFKAAQEQLGLTNAEMARELICSVGMIEQMRAGTKRVSKRTRALLGYLMIRRGASDTRR